MGKKLSKFDEDSIKNYDENSNKGFSLEVDVECPKNLFTLQSDLPFLTKKRRLKNVISLFVIYLTKKTMLCT